MEATAATTLEDIEKALVTAFAAITGLPVLNERNAGPRPAAPFLAFLLVAQEGTPHPITDCEDDEAEPPVFTETIADPVYFTCQISVYGAGAVGLLNKLRQRMYSMQRQWDLGELIGNCGFGPIQNTSTPFQGEMLVQASVTWNFYAVLTEALPADYFDHVHYNVETQPESGEADKVTAEIIVAADGVDVSGDAEVDPPDAGE